MIATGKENRSMEKEMNSLHVMRIEREKMRIALVYAIREGETKGVEHGKEWEKGRRREERTFVTKQLALLPMVSKLGC